MRVSLHDHVGHMSRGDDEMVCVGCGQAWRIVELVPGRRALVAEPYYGSHDSAEARSPRVPRPTLSAPTVSAVDVEEA